MYRCAKTVLSEASALYKTQFVKADLIGADSPSALQRLDQPWLGPCDNIALDLAMYLSISTQELFGGTDLCFIARIDGAIAGAAGVCVLRMLVRSSASGEQQRTVHVATSAGAGAQHQAQPLGQRSICQARSKARLHLYPS